MSYNAIQYYKTILRDKLEFVSEFKIALCLLHAKRDKAKQTDIIAAGSCVETTMYCLFQLYRLDGDDAWSRI